MKPYHASLKDWQWCHLSAAGMKRWGHEQDKAVWGLGGEQGPEEEKRLRTSAPSCSRLLLRGG